MKKSKAKDIDLLYVPEKDEKKKTKKNKKAMPKEKKNKSNEEENEQFNINDEIVIGITPKNDKKKNKQKEKQTSKEALKKEERKNRKGRRFFKFFILFILLSGGIIAFALSPVFEIKTINVEGNIKISKGEIISLSGIKENENIFKTNIGQAKNNIKENAYIESVTIKRTLPSVITINVSEREATFMIEDINGLVYINNQGYLLEIAQDKLNVPTLSGIETDAENLKIGKRLCNDDLQKLEIVLKIMETANSYDIKELITGINIVDKDNFILYLAGEKKTVYIGDASNLNTRMMYLKEILDREKGIESEIFIKGDLNKVDVYTREKV